MEDRAYMMVYGDGNGFFSPQVLDDTIFIIAVGPLNITADVLDDVARVPVSKCTPEVDAKVLDDTTVIQMLSPKLTKTFQDDLT
jgi:hypothetical protein